MREFLQVLIPRSLPGEGYVRAQLTAEANRVLRFTEMPLWYHSTTDWRYPNDHGHVTSRKGQRFENYRVVLRTKGASGQRRGIRFCLREGAPQKTLQVIADHLDRIGLEWFSIRAEFSPGIPRYAIHSKPHSPAA